LANKYTSKIQRPTKKEVEPIEPKIIISETFINEFLDSGCSDGLYWVVAFWYPDNKIAEQYKKLLAEKKIEQISGYIYKVNRR
jgi:hypothetical protein